VPSWLGGAPVYIFLMRQFFLTLPPEIEDAAIVDGASTYQTLLWIMVPLALPAIATISLFSFVGHWNEFLPPLIYLQDDNLSTLSLGLQRFLGTNRSAWAPMMAVATGMTMPIVVIFLLAQRFFVRGIALTGLAGR
jgi:multiple sugar transport system permease protein